MTQTIDFRVGGFHVYGRKVGSAWVLSIYKFGTSIYQRVFAQE